MNIMEKRNRELRGNKMFMPIKGEKRKNREETRERNDKRRE